MVCADVAAGNNGTVGNRMITLNPGSKEAVDKGCTCPVDDGPQLWMDVDCPMHGVRTPYLIELYMKENSHD